jgi:hypothetical protein
MARTITRRCQGKRRKQRGHVFGLFACGRKATHVMETRVGLSRTHYVCEAGECFDSIREGYPASSRPIGGRA